MLDLDHPSSAHVAAAANQMGFILTFAKNMTLSTGKCRADLYLIVEPAFAALRWLNENRFENAPRIAHRISNLQMLLKQLADMLHDETLEPPDGHKVCPACGSQVTFAGRYQPHGVSFTVPAERYCSRCLDTVMPAYWELESMKNGFGTEAI